MNDHTPASSHASPRAARRWRVPGMTIVELMIAMSITATVAGATASIIAATAYATESTRGMRGTLVRHLTADAQLAGAIRGSTMVLDHDENVLVLWRFDDDGNRAPNLSELVFVELDSTARTITAFRPAPAVADDTKHRLSDNFAGMLTSVKGSTARTAEGWGTHVRSWSLAFDHDDVLQSRLVSYRLQVGEGSAVDTVIGAAALR